MQFNLEYFTHDGGYKIINDKTYREMLIKDIAACRGIKEREAVPYLCCAQSYLPPTEAFDFIVRVVPFQDTIAYNCACEILRKLAPKVDLGGIIDNFQSGDSIRRALIINSIPLPFDEEYIPFIFEAAKSEYNLNRCAFLNLVYRMKDQDPPISPNLTNMIKHSLVKFSEDNSIPVQCVWIKSALHYLKDNANLPSMLNSIIRNADPEVKASLGLHFAEAYNVTKDVIVLLGDKNPRVVASAIPSLKTMNLNDELLRPLFENPSHIVRVLILRNLKTVPEYVVKDYMKDNSNEVRIDLIRFLCKYEKGIVYAKKIFEDAKNGEEDSWRKSYELLSMPFEMLEKIGQDAFHFALKNAQCHPLKLMKKAIEVLALFAQNDSSYATVVNVFMNLLEEKNTRSSLQALSLLQNAKKSIENES